MQLLNEQEIERRKDREALMQLGIDPYPALSYPINASSGDIHIFYALVTLLISSSVSPGGTQSGASLVWPV